MRKRECTLTRIEALLVLVVLAIAVATQASYAQPSGAGGDDGVQDSGPIREIMKNIVNRTANQVGKIDHQLTRSLVLPPLPGEQASAESSKDENIFGQITSYGSNKSDNYQVLLPPLKGFRQLGDSQVMLDMYKELITKKIPVLAQTFMMVENGAGSGYFHALNSVSGVSSNILEANDFQLKVMNETDPSGQMKDAWISSVYTHVSKNDQGWHAALLSVAGDSASEKQGKQSKAFSELKSEQFDFTTIKEGSNEGGDSKSILLSTLLFDSQNKKKYNLEAQSGSNRKAYKNRELDQVKEEFIKYFGDLKLEIRAANQGEEKRLVWQTRISPAADQNGERRGLARAQFEETKVAWNGIHKVLEAFCNFRKNDPNKEASVGSFQMAMGENHIKMEDWVLASAPDYPLSFDLMLTMYDLFSQGEPNPQAVKCEELGNRVDNMPAKLGQISSTKPNDCSSPDKGCLRDRVYLHVAHIIGRSRALYTYSILLTVVEKFATTPMQQMLLQRVIDQTFDGLDLQSELSENRVRLGSIKDLLGKFKQNNTGLAGMTRPNQSSIPASTAVDVESGG